jgi:DNA-directed RNA polymerase alpha subunit
VARPFFNSSIAELESTYFEVGQDIGKLGALLTELTYRNTDRAHILRAKIERDLRVLANGETAALLSEVLRAPAQLDLREPSQPNKEIAAKPVPENLVLLTILPFSVRAQNVFSNMNLRTLGDLVERCAGDLLAQPNMGRTTLLEIETWLADRGLRLGMDVAGATDHTDDRPEEQQSATANPALSIKLRALNLSTRARSLFDHSRLTYVGDLVSRTEAQLFHEPNVGRTTIRELRAALAGLGLELGANVGCWTPAAAATMQQVAVPLVRAIAPEPTDLTSALRQAVESIEPHERNRDIIIEHNGWDGRPSRTLEELGNTIGVTRERVRQISARAERKLSNRGYPPSALVETIKLVRSLLPLTQAELDKAMSSAGLSREPFCAAGIVAAAQCFEIEAGFVVVGRDSDAPILPTGAESLPTLLMRQAVQGIGPRGCVLLDELVDIGSDLVSPCLLRSEFVLSMLKRSGRLDELAGEEIWLWSPASALRGRNRLVNNIRTVLAAAPKLPLRELRDAVRRSHRMQHFAPPIAILRALCDRLPFCSIVGNDVVRNDESVKWSDVLSESDKTFVEIIREHGPIITRSDFLRIAISRGMNENTFNVYSGYSVVVWRPAPGYYAVVGASIPAGALEAEMRRRRPKRAEMIDSGWTADSRVFVCVRLNASVINSGILSIPSALKKFIQGNYQLRTFGNHDLGRIEVRDVTCWNLRKLLRATGAEDEDTILLVFDPNSRESVGWVGGTELAEGVSDGRVDKIVSAAAAAAAWEDDLADSERAIDA